MCAYSPAVLRRALNSIDTHKDDGTRRVLENLVSDPSFWTRDDVRDILNQLSIAKERVALAKEVNDLDFYVQSLNDPDLSDDAQDALAGLSDRIERVFMTGPQENAPALVSITAGAGGEDARDFCAMTLRELIRYAERRGLCADVQDQTYEGNGLREATVRISGPRAFLILSAESGKRRLVRQSPFGSGGRQTSFCAVSVVPEIPFCDARIEPHDLRIETYRDTGPGGQHRNTTDSAVRITHIPTGLTAKSAQRSQHENKRIAMATLASRVADLERARAIEETNALRNGPSDSGFGGHVRTMVLDPYHLVRNEITGETSSDVSGYMNGGVLDVRAPF